MNIDNTLDEYFKTTNLDNINITPDQKKAIDKNYHFVQGKDFYKGFYEENIVHKILIRYFQIAIFNDHDKRAIRSYLFEGKSTDGGSCIYNYKILEIKDYNISEEALDKFIKKIQNIPSKATPEGEFKVMFKYYPVYNFDYTNPPEGNELSQCQSELLNY